jgi:osmoprotectant transport system substrate-binding protein
MHARTKFLVPLALAALVTTACGESGSSGTGGGDEGGSSQASGEACVGIAGEQLVVLEDDKQLQNADNIIPAVNAAAAAANPALLETLNAVSEVLTTEDLIELNAAVDVERQAVDEVASGYVEEQGLAAGLSGGSGPVVVGAADFTESQVLATVYADVLTAAGFDASVQTVGNRELYLPALQRGEIQAFPEYVATLTEFIEGDDDTEVASGDVDETVGVLTPLAEGYGLVVGEPAEAADQNAFAVTQEFADELGISTLSELADACGDGSLTLGGPGECPTRAACQPGLEETYGLEFESFQEYDAGGPLTKAAIQQGDVSIGLVFSSDGALAQG